MTCKYVSVTVNREEGLITFKLMRLQREKSEYRRAGSVDVKELAKLQP